MDKVSKSIIKTLCYADIFDYPLSQSEIHKYLISADRVGGQKIKTCLNKLYQNGHLKTYNKKYRMTGNDIVWYCLSDREEVCQTRASRIKFSRSKLDKTRNLVWWLRRIPQIESVFLTGSLAMENAKQDDDIDIMVVTKPGRLWQTRLIVTSILELLSQRRKPEYAHAGNKAKDKVCANLYLDSNNLKLKPKQRNLYTAHEVVQAVPLVDKTGAHSRLLAENSWVSTFLPHSLDANNSHKTNKKNLIISKAESGWFETLSYNCQSQYMRSKMTSEIIDKNRALFHPRNTAEIVIGEYKKRLKKYLS